MLRSFVIPTKSVAIGDQFHRLTVAGPVFRVRDNAGRPISCVVCQCRCGKYSAVKLNHLLRRSTKSCGCANADNIAASKKNRTPEEARLHVIWRGMKKRCHRPTCREYSDYGGRGIRVCDEWRTSFRSFKVWSLANGYAAGLSIDRKKNDGDYCPGNCRWVTQKVQANNTRRSVHITAFGETKTVGNWASDRRCLVTLMQLHNRIRHGWPAEKAILTPLARTRRPKPVRQLQFAFAGLE